MAILIDPPLWPAHGTRFSHLVSDHSLAELHAFAAAAGLSERAFDADHYDVPVRLHAELVARGALAVPAGELIRRLRRSGLRVPARRRPRPRRAALLGRWEQVLPGRADLGRGVLDRWEEDHRRYHTSEHLLDVLEALDKLCRPHSPPPAVLLAAWFHDAVHRGEAGEDERQSAALAQRTLDGAGLPGDLVAEVTRLVLVTMAHRPDPEDLHGGLLCDADLAVLGRDEAGYGRYLHQVRQEYAHVTDADWRTGRSAVVQGLLELQPLFRTPQGVHRWQDRARANLTAELESLRSPS
ncbi:DUF4031 domain-containing protein [Ruania suaedae]|uniref:DUF4031 domain-containing protein n=1 Tax=Ruania suaedae TaxID=2897774 RepID=UPI001E522F7D|nr:DUF4031 domain-containing protein [Ruania suaedae]UFU03552.1 DUF4031 domain-containing protein [Ruania suaedae]